ncbi:hypothetical protein ACHAPO_011590 [Fusarium lateritium]
MSTEKGPISLQDEQHPPTSLKTLSEQDAAANEAQRVETTLTAKQAFSYYYKAVAWSVAMSMSTIMESYGLLLMNSFFAFPQFQKKYGVELPNGSYSVPAKWQLALTITSNIGLIIGVFANGYCADRWGLRKVMLTSHVFFAGFVFINFFADNVETLVVGTLLISIPCGFFAAATPSYAAEVSPLRLNGYLTVYVNLCWVMGKMISFGVLTSMLKNPTQWSYRIPFAIQWGWPPFMLIATYLAPESPWWLIRNGRVEEAEKNLGRLCSAPANVIDPKNTIAMMTRTIETERDMNIQGSYLDCFRGENLRRTEIAMISWGCQILPGFAIQNYITYFFTLAGLSSGDSFKLSLGISIGPIPYGIAANVGASNLRVKTISLARNTYYFLSIINVIVAPYLLNSQEANLKGKAAFPAAGLTIMLLVWTYFRLPEVKGLTAETLDHLFENKVSARKFRLAAKEYQ